MKNGTKKNISKISTRDNNIKVKKKSENNTNIIKKASSLIKIKNIYLIEHHLIQIQISTQ